MMFRRFLLVVLTVSLFTGCGDKGETNPPAVKLTASTLVSSTDGSGHVHNVSIPFIDVSAAPADAGYQYRSDSSSGHSHVIALSKQQMIDLNNGMRLTLTSSIGSDGTSPAQVWNIQGGSVLYEKNCYNCHSNDKRNHAPMNVSFTPDQTSAVINPGVAPLSISTPAIPDPNYTSSSAAPDGVVLYAGACASCHGVLASSTKSNKTTPQIRDAINNNSVTGMGGLSSLTDAQLQAIAAALVK